MNISKTHADDQFSLLFFSECSITDIFYVDTFFCLKTEHRVNYLYYCPDIVGIHLVHW